jgi:hypothetical protein
MPPSSEQIIGFLQSIQRLLVLIGQKKALGIAVRNDRPQRRYSGLLGSLRCHERHSALTTTGSEG